MNHDAYHEREVKLCIEYFERKGRGDFSIPVPDFAIFERIANSDRVSLLLATFCEREWRALYLGIGLPVENAAAAEMTAALDSSSVEIGRAEIIEIENEIEELESEIRGLQSKAAEIESRPAPLHYVPEDALPLIEQLQREGA